MKSIFGKLKPIRHFLSNRVNMQKGTSALGVILVLASATLVIGGVTVKASDVFSEATDVQGIANLRQLTTALELYYSGYETYPRVEANDSIGRWNQLISALKREHLLASLPPKQGYDYQDLNSGQNYVISVLLKNPESPYLELDWDGVIEGFDCQDPYYCLQM